MVPRPSVDDVETEYVALKAALGFDPLDVLISSAPVIVPVGLVPLAANSPENAVTPNDTGFVAKPA